MTTALIECSAEQSQQINWYFLTQESQQGHAGFSQKLRSVSQTMRDCTVSERKVDSINCKTASKTNIYFVSSIFPFTEQETHNKAD